MRIAYVCTNYNNSALTIDAVDSLLRSANHDIEVVVVDNASREEEAAKLRPLTARHRCVHVIENKSNVGYFRGLNVGLASLRERRPDMRWVIVGNNDLEFPPDFCDRVQRHMRELEGRPVISPDIVTLEGEHQNPHVISDISTTRELFYDLYYCNYYLGLAIYKLAKMFPRLSERPDEQKWETSRPIYQGHGSCYLLTPRFFAHFSELWAPTFMMSEEYFLSKQLKDIGEQVYYTPRIRVTHLWHGSLDAIPSRRRWDMARDAHRVYRKYVKVFRRS